MENDTSTNTTNTNVENTTNNNVTDNNTTTITGSSAEYEEMLTTIHTDLGFICSFLVFFTLVILLRYIYKFFNMFF